jgi:hypothetical protein
VPTGHIAESGYKRGLLNNARFKEKGVDVRIGSRSPKPHAKSREILVPIHAHAIMPQSPKPGKAISHQGEAPPLR